MIDKSFVEKIESMAVPFIYEDGELQRSDKQLHIIKPPQADFFSVQTLQAIIDYCANELEDHEHYILHIKNHKEVVLMSRLCETFRTREIQIIANAFTSDFAFGRFMPVDKFIIALQAHFLKDETVEKILKLVGNMTSTKEVGTKDDGVTQRVEAKVGLAKVENVSVPNPVSLAPYRTFVEVDQPYSNFILRMNSEHECALFEADGGFWKIDAMKNVHQLMLSEIEKLPMAEKSRITILA